MYSGDAVKCLLTLLNTGRNTVFPSFHGANAPIMADSSTPT